MARIVVFLSFVLFAFVQTSLCQKVVLATNSKKSLIPSFNIAKFVTGYGYPFETHDNLQTEDGYLLTLHRIPFGRNNSNSSPTTARPVALLVHGLGGTSSNWIDGGPNYSLGFLLADRGYDVWLANVRGTTYSKKHVTLDPVKDKAKFWDFSWHEMGYYDLPTKINHIIQVTKQDKLYYIAHSQGNTAYIVMMTTRPEMNDRIKLMLGLAPPVYGLGDQLNLPKTVAYSTFRQLDFGRKIFGLYTDPFGPRIEEFFCKSQFSVQMICDMFLNMRTRLFGFDPQKTHLEHWQIIKQTVPDSTSLKQSLHYIQVALTDEFRQYDLGTLANMQKYGTVLPPFYDLNKVTSRVALFSGEKDMFVTTHNVDRLAKKLPNVVYKDVVPGFAHLDFLAVDAAAELLYKKLFALMYNYSN